MSTNKRCYSFTVWVTAPEQTDDAGYDQKEIERLVKNVLMPLHRSEPDITVDWELAFSEEVK